MNVLSLKIFSFCVLLGLFGASGLLFRWEYDSLREKERGDIDSPTNFVQHCCPESLRSNDAALDDFCNDQSNKKTVFLMSGLAVRGVARNVLESPGKHLFMLVYATLHSCVSILRVAQRDYVRTKT